jgi:hypothetical protein
MQKMRRNPRAATWRRSALVRPILTAALAVTAILWMSSCSETQNPLEWDEAARGGLGVEPVTVAAETLVVANASYHAPIRTGASSYFMVGEIEQFSQETGAITAMAYLKWDLSELPEGQIGSAELEFILRGYEQTPAPEPDPFVLQIFAVADAWEEDSLGIAAIPSYDLLVGESGVLDIANLPGFPLFPDSTDASLTGDDFSLPELTGLVEQWRSDEALNHGLLIRPSRDAQSGEGFLRFISREGTPRDVSAEISTPALVVAFTDPDTTITLEAVADGYVVVSGDELRAAAPSHAVAENGADLLLGSGYVQRVLMGFDFTDPAVFPPGVAIHKATLHLNMSPGADWIGDAEKSLTVYAYATQSEWTEDEVPDEIALMGDWYSWAVAAGDETTLDLDIREPVQLMIEGAALSIVLRAGSEADLFRSLTIPGRGASDGRPRVSVVYTAPGSGRLGPWPQPGQSGGGR